MKKGNKSNLALYLLELIMKSRPIILIFVLFLSIATFAQEKDTTKLKLGNKEVIIINKQTDIEKSIQKLEFGIQDFETKIDNLENEIQTNEIKTAQLQEQLNTTDDETRKTELKSEIEKLEKEKDEMNKQMEAYEQGIEQIEEEIEELEEELEELEDEKEYIIEDGEGKKHSEIKFKRKKFKGHWAGFEFGLNSFVNSDFSMTLPENADFMELNNDLSWGFSLNFAEVNLPLFSNYAGIVTGIGFQWNIFNLKQNIDLVEDANGVIYGEMIDPLERDYKKNVLQTAYLNLPIIFEFQIPIENNRRRLYFGAGFVGSIKVGSKTKKFYEIDGHKEKRKVRGDYQISPLRYGLTARMGYRAIQVFADYSLVPLFEKDKGPELYPFTLGLRLNF